MSAYSGRTSVLKHSPRNPVCVLRKDMKAICNNSIPAAIILSIMEHWTNVKMDEAEQKIIENEARAKEGMDLLEINLWVYKSYQNFVDDSLGMLKDHEVRHGLKLLLENGFIEKRTNPKFKWDRTLQYRLCVEVINQAIGSLIATSPSVAGNGSTMNGHQINGEQTTDQRSASNGAIPKVSSEITTETSLEGGMGGDFSQSQEEEKIPTPTQNEALRNLQIETEGLSREALDDKKSDSPPVAKCWQEEVGKQLNSLCLKFPSEIVKLNNWVRGQAAKGISPSAICAAMGRVDNIRVREDKIDNIIGLLNKISGKVVCEDLSVDGVNSYIRKNGEEFRAKLARWEQEKSQEKGRAIFLAQIVTEEIERRQGKVPFGH